MDLGAELPKRPFQFCNSAIPYFSHMCLCWLLIIKFLLLTCSSFPHLRIFPCDYFQSVHLKVCRCLFPPFGENQAMPCPSPVLSPSSIFCALTEVSVSSSAIHLQVLQLPWDVIYRGQDTWTHLEQPCALLSSFTSLACQFLLTKAHPRLFTQNLPLTDKDRSRKGMEGSPCSYHLGTLERLSSPGPGLPWSLGISSNLGSSHYLPI